MCTLDFIQKKGKHSFCCEEFHRKTLKEEEAFWNTKKLFKRNIENGTLNAELVRYNKDRQNRKRMRNKRKERQRERE